MGIPLPPLTKEKQAYYEQFASTFSPPEPSLTITPPTPDVATLSKVTCSPSEVFRKSATTRSNTATGSDGISSTILRMTCHSIVEPLAGLFNLSLESATVQSDWKTSKVTPNHKSGDTSSASNYRPISLLSLVSKVLERFVHEAILVYQAFDSLPHYLILNALVRIRVCGKLMLWVKSYLSGTHSKSSLIWLLQSTSRSHIGSPTRFNLRTAALHHLH